VQRVYKRPDSPTYWCAFKNHLGRWERRSTGKRDRRAAEIEAARLEQDAADPRASAAASFTLKAALERVVTDRAAKGRAHGTLTMYASKAGRLLYHFGEGALLAEMALASEVDGYIEARLADGAARTTIGKELTTLRVALKLAKRRKEWFGDLDEVLPESWGTGYKPGTTHLTAWEFLWLLPHLRDDRAAHVCYLVATAADWTPSLRARAEDIDLRQGEVRVPGTKTETRDRAIPIVGFMRPLLERVLAWHREPAGLLFRPWSNVRRELHDACERAGVAPVTPRDLRRTCSTWLRCAGVEPHLIAKMLGHADARMVERIYGQIPAAALGGLIRERLRQNVAVAP
jgi:integrase